MYTQAEMEYHHALVSEEVFQACLVKKKKNGSMYELSYHKRICAGELSAVDFKFSIHDCSQSAGTLSGLKYKSLCFSRQGIDSNVSICSVSTMYHSS